MTDKQHGGKRKHAGRKPSENGPTKVVAVSIPQSFLPRLDAVADKKGWNRSQAITEAIRKLLGTHESKLKGTITSDASPK